MSENRRFKAFFSKFSNESHVMSRLPLPPLTAEKARMAKDAWNTRDPP